MSLRVNQKQLKKWLIKKDLYEFIKEFWYAYETAEYVDCWLVEWQSECFMYSLKHFLPNYIWKDWISDEEYAEIKKKTGGVCDVRDKIFQGRHTHNHDWNMPPRHMKSSIMNVCGPVWAALNCPIKIASVSHTDRLSTDMNEKRQKIFKSDLYRYYFGSDVELKPIKSTTSSIKLLNGTELYSVCMTSFTGFGADCIIADDLISSDHARKDAMVLKNAVEFFRKTLPTRLNSKNTGVIWQVQQRLGNGDISGVIANDKGLKSIYSHTELQAISSKDITLIYPCSGKVKVIKKGDLLWPDRFGDYTSVKLETGIAEFETQYNQNPSFSSVNIVKDKHIHFINERDAEEFKQLAEFQYGSHDCCVKEKKTNDFHGFCGGYGKGAELIIDDSWEEHMAYIRERNLMRNLQQVHPSIIQVVEDKANGAPLLQDLHSQVSGLASFDPGGMGKKERLELAVVYMESGQVRFVENEATLRLIEKLKKFPMVEHDDDIDAFTQLVIYHNTQREMGIYTGAFTYQNVIPDIERAEDEFVFYDYAATLVGDMVKVIAMTRDDSKDEYIVEKEWEFKGISNFEKFMSDNEKNTGIFLDASIKNILNTIINNVGQLTTFNEHDRDKSISLMKSGFYNKKIKVCRSCSKTINDIAKLRVTDASRQDASDKPDTLNEGFAGCLRGMITYLKGYSNYWY